MAVTYTPDTQEFLQTLEGTSLEITYALLKIVEGIGIDVEARYYKNIILINLKGKDILGISPRKTKYSMYLYNLEAKAKYLPKLGKIDDGVGCLRFKKWEDINPDGISEMFRFMLENPLNWYGNVSIKA